MSRAILMSIKPRYVAKILSGEKTIEVRKKFPKDYVGWVYVYCTKGKEQLYSDFTEDGLQFFIDNKAYGVNILNGKVLARFWCDKVEDFDFCECSKYVDNVKLYTECVKKYMELCEKACISCVQMVEYLFPEHTGKAIHISKLEVFDKTKELKSFVYYSKGGGSWCSWLNCIYLEHTKEECENCKDIHLQKSPQSYCYIWE